jgi:Fe-S cluster assembly ATP-binding protein
MTAALEIRNLHVNIAETGAPILRGVDLTIKQGEVHALMGPNGSGKSTLANVMLGNPAYEVTAGQIIFDGQDPVSIPGVTVANFLRQAINARMKAQDPESKGISVPQFTRLLRSKMDSLSMDHSFAGRYLNEGFSGGEKKRAEILQLATLEPKIAILDETDSGLDIDALRIVSEGVNKLKGPDLGVLVITHYQRILNYIQPEFVHVMFQGRIVESGGPDLALRLEESGYKWIQEKYGVAE